MIFEFPIRRGICVRGKELCDACLFAGGSEWTPCFKGEVCRGDDKDEMMEGESMREKTDHCYAQGQR